MSDKPPSLGDLRMPESEIAPETAYHQLHLSDKYHQQRHVHLHRALDELVADWLRHHIMHGLTARPSCSTIMELMQWSYEQTQNPTNPPGDA